MEILIGKNNLFAINLPYLHQSECDYKTCLSNSIALKNLILKNIKGVLYICQIYILRSKLCGQPYVGKTVQMISSRMCGHWHNFFELVRLNEKISEDADKDEFAPGMHLYKDHGIRNFEYFNNSNDVTLLEKCTPSALDVKEHF